MAQADQPDPQCGQPDWLRVAVRPELAGLVSDIVFYRETGAPAPGQVEMATLVFPLVISFGAPFAIALGRRPGADETYASFAAGLFAGPVMIDSPGTAECVQVNFTPLGARRFFGLPMRELASRMVPLDDLGDDALALLRRRLGELNDPAARLDLVERFVLARIAASPAIDPALAWAYGRLAGTGGRIRIASLTGRLEWSRRRLSQGFQDVFGLPPKTIARMLRFQGALAQAGQTQAPDWADIAAACGYADQAHLSREFSEFAGASPTAWRAAAARA